MQRKTEQFKLWQAVCCIRLLWLCLHHRLREPTLKYRNALFCNSSQIMAPLYSDLFSIAPIPYKLKKNTLKNTFKCMFKCSMNGVRVRCPLLFRLESYCISGSPSSTSTPRVQQEPGRLGERFVALSTQMDGDSRCRGAVSMEGPALLRTGMGSLYLSLFVCTDMGNVFACTCMYVCACVNAVRPRLSGNSKPLQEETSGPSRQR